MRCDDVSNFFKVQNLNLYPFSSRSDLSFLFHYIPRIVRTTCSAMSKPQEDLLRRPLYGLQSPSKLSDPR